ncbi:hypothetical protein ACPCSP_25715 [Streptomyces cinereoruber]|uniref:hypothetical protein n=1 Tax=Streptomyces cinereoruber TaxID=67260 RepID=UPI003C2D6A73
MARVLFAVAEHFASTTPSAPLDPMSLPVAVDAESYRLHGRSVRGRAAAFGTIVSKTIPKGAVSEGATRGECAAIVRGLAERVERASERGAEHERAGDEQDVPGRSHPELVGGGSDDASPRPGRGSVLGGGRRGPERAVVAEDSEAASGGAAGEDSGEGAGAADGFGGSVVLWASDAA